jgi:hypothetical protein
MVLVVVVSAEMARIGRENEEYKAKAAVQTEELTRRKEDIKRLEEVRMLVVRRECGFHIVQSFGDVR